MDEEKFVITPEAALWTVVRGWNLGREWNPKIYHAALDELMELFGACGFVEKADEPGEVIPFTNC